MRLLIGKSVAVISVIFLGALIIGCQINNNNEKDENGIFLQGREDISSIYNRFEDKDGFLSFDYKNNYRVEKNNGIYYLSELKTGNIAFKAFLKTPEIKFPRNGFACVGLGEEEVCYSKATPGHVVKNLKFFITPKNSELRYEFLSRGEALKKILELRYTDEDFSRYSDNCFYDVSYSHPLSGEICFAHREGIVTGIGGYFHPESSVNIWGIIQFLFRIFEIEDKKFDHSIESEPAFRMMTRHHAGFEDMAKAYYEGLFENTENEDIWTNRAVYKREAFQIIESFLGWKDGREIRNYRDSDNFALDNEIFIYKTFKDFDFESKNPENFRNLPEFQREVKVVQDGKDVELYYLTGPQIYKHFHTISSTYKNDVKKVTLVFEDRLDEMLEMEFLVEYNRGRSTERYGMIVESDQFKHLKTDKKTPLDDPNILPNEVSPPRIRSPFVTSIKIYMDEDDYKNINEKRTLNTRYPAWLEIHYPDGKTQGMSVVIKTRGNSDRGYIKSSYTIEAFGHFEENENFKGDEFLEGSNEFKLRSNINEKTGIREKLIYKGFEQLGYPSPRFFETTLEINNQPFGFYQVTEAVKANFFRSRDIDVVDYYYPRNRNTDDYLANLTYIRDNETTADFYRIKQGSNPFRLIEFIRALDREEEGLLPQIDTKNIFDYALFAYITTASDSLVYNYYLYQDRDDHSWKMFFWDGDTAFQHAPKINKKDFREYANRSEGRYNNLIRYVFLNLTDEQFNEYYDDFMKRWKDDVTILEQLEFYQRHYREYFNYDNALWNGRFLERNDHFFDTMKSIEEMKKVVRQIS